MIICEGECRQAFTDGEALAVHLGHLDGPKSEQACRAPESWSRLLELVDLEVDGRAEGAWRIRPEMRQAGQEVIVD